MSFAGKVALVTGAASGIGRATALALRDARVVGLALVDRTGPGLVSLCEEIGPRAFPLEFDITHPESWRAAESQIATRFGRLDFAVVNAGIADSGPIAELSFEAWRKVLAVNLDGAFLTLACGMRLIKSAGRGGAVVVVSSIAAQKVEHGTAAYSASKAGALALARVAAKEGAADRIRVNALLPGGVETPIWRGMDFFEQMIAELGSERAAFDALAAMATPLKRYATPEETAGQILFLLSDAAATITGAAIVADGGYSI